ncbi:hypothetical protein QL285_043863 [Trifolium repens]|nr:hypothetical protein QL285_043863 [Trifolium repens]
MRNADEDTCVRGAHAREGMPTQGALKLDSEHTRGACKKRQKANWKEPQRGQCADGDCGNRGQLVPASSRVCPILFLGLLLGPIIRLSLETNIPKGHFQLSIPCLPQGRIH